MADMAMIKIKNLYHWHLYSDQFAKFYHIYSWVHVLCLCTVTLTCLRAWLHTAFIEAKV